MEATEAIAVEPLPLTERQVWDNLVAEFDVEYLLYEPIGQRMGKVLYKIKIHLEKHGLDRGRNGRWATFLRERRIPESTARDWVSKYEEGERLKPEERFYAAPRKTRKTHKDGQKNRAVPAAFRKAKVVSAAEKDPEKADKNAEVQRSAVECVFVLTEVERMTFMGAVRKLGELRSTEAMYRAVVDEAKGN